MFEMLRFSLSAIKRNAAFVARDIRRLKVSVFKIRPGITYRSCVGKILLSYVLKKQAPGKQIPESDR